MQGVSNAADLNEVVSKGSSDQLIMVAEAYQNEHLMEVAEKIYENKQNIKIVLIAGPSSSGKTTTSKKLAIYLKTKGINSYQLSVDDYFKEREATPLKPNGEPDFESIRAIDTNLFNRHLSKLLSGEKVLIPEYNFVLGKKEFNKNYIKLKDDDVIIIEGLHCLNEELTMSIERKNKFKVYVSPLTQMNIDNHSRIHTSDIRKLRRIVRDNRNRGRNAADTLRMWANIREGEEQYIFPYQDDADIVLNTSLIYEIGILKTYVEPLLFSVSSDDSSYPEALRLINFLRNFLPLPSDMVPKDSILREFIGGSAFDKKN
jgi:uridine kinase